MHVLRTITHQLFGLVVDDVGFAVAVVGWIALVWLLCATILPPTPWVAVMLFCGLGGILIDSVARRSGAAR